MELLKKSEQDKLAFMAQTKELLSQSYQALFEKPEQDKAMVLAKITQSNDFTKEALKQASSATNEALKQVSSVII